MNQPSMRFGAQPWSQATDWPLSFEELTAGMRDRAADAGFNATPSLAGRTTGSMALGRQLSTCPSDCCEGVNQVSAP